MQKPRYEIQIMPISQIKLNPNNPRQIKDDKFDLLIKSIKELPEMMDIRPIAVNKDMFVLGGNMRLRAVKAAGWKEAPVMIVDLDEEKASEFVIKDNGSFGEWDMEELANNYELEELQLWGVDFPQMTGDESKEINNKDLMDEGKTITCPKCKFEFEK